MTKSILQKISKLGNLVVAWFNFFMFFAMRPCWSGISKTLGYEDSGSWLVLNLPVIIWILLGLLFAANIVLYCLLGKKGRSMLYSYVLNGVNCVFLVAVFVIIALGAKDYMDYIWPTFWEYFFYTLATLALLWLVLVYPRTAAAKSKWYKRLVVVMVLVVMGLSLVNPTINDIHTGAVVYAVEDQYQIVFSSKTEARAWVEIDGVRYYDNYNGSNRSNTRIHKVTVPMKVLNDAGAYEIHVQKMTYRGPFGGYKGRDISQSYTFRGVDASDGLDYYAISDIHMGRKISVDAYKNCGKKVELLVMAGDIVSMMDSFDDANLTNVIAHDMTGGSIPVIYARGNHELKGKYSEYFDQFVGSFNGKFYYNVWLDNTYVAVLDIGEDHDDDWWEYYGTADYEKYRAEQYDMLSQTLGEGKYASCDYKMAVCHIPPVFVNSRKNHEHCKATLTDLLNKLDINMCISGHQHDLLIFEPDTVVPNQKLTYNESYKPGGKTYKGYVTDYQFVNMLVSKRGYEQLDSSDLIGVDSQIGLLVSVDFSANTQTCTYTNSLGNAVSVVNPFADINYGTTFAFDLATNRLVK
ncbi:MAG: metallophosphoesterase [Clostridia bacterium]|nr:metallophosphoesterase [Clostridia bacterium]